MTEPTFHDVFPRPFEAQPSSFAEVLRRSAPDAVPDWLAGKGMPDGLHDKMVEGTTVLAIAYATGVVIAGDRRATAGNLIARHDMRKIFPADHYSAVGIAGAAGPAMELARVFSTELEHYEKVEGEPLSLEGKSNKLASMVRANLGLAMQGIIVVPLLAGVDPRSGIPGIFEYDPVGGRYESTEYATSGSGSLIARQTLKFGYRDDATQDGAVELAIAALFDAADQDSATGGPDLIRGVMPIAAVIDADGYREIDEDGVRAHVQTVIAARTGQQ